MKTLKRRRREHKTNYSKRIKLLKGNSPRIVFRKTNRYVIAQYVTSEQAKDKVEFGVTSKNLLNYGWPKEFQGSLKSLPASYLTGFLFGKKIAGKEKPIVDFGMIRNLHKTKIYAFLKGLVDAGIEVKTQEKTFPEQERIEGGSLKNKIPFSEIKSKVKNERRKTKTRNCR